jgi:hypothetical protein
MPTPNRAQTRGEILWFICWSLVKKMELIYLSLPACQISGGCASDPVTVLGLRNTCDGVRMRPWEWLERRFRFRR